MTSIRSSKRERKILVIEHNVNTVSVCILGVKGRVRWIYWPWYNNTSEVAVHLLNNSLPQWLQRSHNGHDNAKAKILCNLMFGIRVNSIQWYLEYVLLLPEYIQLTLWKKACCPTYWTSPLAHLYTYTSVMNLIMGMNKITVFNRPNSLSSPLIMYNVLR